MAKRHPLQHLLFPLLLPLSVVYGAGGRLRRCLAQKGWLRSWKPPCPCVSLGNISWGGTGKTPVVDWLLAWAEKQGLAAAVLTRGYGAHPPRPAFPAVPGASPAECGDEPLMLALRHPRASILVDPDRNRAARSLAPPPDLFLLDDGFQHLSTARDLDLVLLDKDDIRLSPAPGAEPSNWNRVLPAGTWREGKSALAQAGAYLVKAEPEEWAGLVPALKKRLSAFPRPVFAFHLKPEGLRSLTGEGPFPAEAIQGPYVFVCGIGAPEQALATVTAFLGRAPEKMFAFPDHYDFHDSLKQLVEPRLPIVCTGKDAVKLRNLRLPAPCFSMDVTARFFAALSAEELQGQGALKALDFPSWWENWWAQRH